MKKVLSVLLALAMMLGLCGTAFAAVTQEDILGLWNMDMNSMLGILGDEEEAEAMKPFLSMMKCTMEFTADGKCILKMSFMGQEDIQEGTYALADGKISMDGGAYTEITLENDVLTIYDTDAAMSFTRAGAESEGSEMSDDEQMAALLALLGSLEGDGEEEEQVPAGAPGKLEVVSENGMYVKGYSNYYYAFAKVQNAGESDVMVYDCLLKVFDESGAEIASRDYGSTYARYLKPGEYTYVNVKVDVGEAIPASHTLELEERHEMYSENVRYPVTAEMALNVEDGWSVNNYMVALLNNNTGNVLYDTELVMALMDAEGNIVFIDDKTCYDVGILPDSAVNVRLEIPDEFIEYFNTNNVKLQSVDAIAYEEVDLDW